MKVGIAGTGFMGHKHAECYENLNDIQVYAYSEQDPERIEKFKQKYPEAILYNDFYDMIEDGCIDIIDICLPTPLHSQTAISALKLNKHVLLEKPISLSVSEAEKILKAAESSRGKFMTAHVLRFWPEYNSIRKAVKEYFVDEDIKEVYASRINELPVWSAGTWIMDEEKSGGLIIDLMIHDIDYITWNFGKAARVFSNGIYNNNGFALQVMVILELESGVTAYIEGGYLNPKGKGLTTQMRIYGSSSMIEMYSNDCSVKLFRGGDIKDIPVEAKDGYLEEIKYFVKCIREDKDPWIITGADAVNSLAVCLSLKKSLKEKTWIDIHEF